MNKSRMTNAERRMYFRHKRKLYRIEQRAAKRKSLAGTYKVTGAGALNLRSGAGTGKDKKVLTTMQSGETCQCYGYYTDVSGVKWLYVAYKNVVGFASSKYLKK